MIAVRKPMVQVEKMKTPAIFMANRLKKRVARTMAELVSARRLPRRCAAASIATNIARVLRVLIASNLRCHIAPTLFVNGLSLELRIAIQYELGMIVAIDESGSFASSSGDRQF